MFNRILVQVDPESDNRQLMSKVASLVEHFGGQLMLFSSVYCRSIEHGYLFDDDGKEEAMKAYVKARLKELEKLSAAFAEDDIHVEVAASWSTHKVSDLLERVEVFDADLVVVPLAETNLIERWFSETETDLARECPCPLLLVHDRIWQAPVKMAVGLDPFHQDSKPSQLDENLLTMAAELADFFKVEPAVVHSIHTLPHSAIFDEHVVTNYESLKVQVIKEHKASVDDLIQRSPLEGRAKVHYLNGECHIELPKYVTSHGLDILLLGHAEHGFADRVLQGDMLDKIIDEIPCDMLIIK